ncbi:sugar ABC transporter substrate-binding protein [Pseudonocardia kujensis]|uniref:sugar ABC transporter substrate-binding protein n=1 Tax=Pseudonocardia kujensis TaxID=1128675 RepID=UPI001E497844|nr:sugar ABC transporter substrate-binding protein [Pseudonocardia kujensis]MCE0767447.1 sugar ABC transporter substrate-binding protein [Pseudonocardia kujensis]
MAGTGLVASLLAACTQVQPGPTAGEGGGGKPVKMLSTSYGNVIPWTTQGYAAQKYWARQFGVELTQLDPGGDPAKQLSQLEAALAQKWDVAIINGIIQGNLAAPARKLVDAGTAVISYLNDVALPDDPVPGLLSTVQADHYQLAFDMTTKLCNGLEGKGKLIETQGIAGSSNVVDRHRGFSDAVKAFPGVEVVASDYGNFVTDKAQSLWESYMIKYPVIDGAFLHNEDMTFGALNALIAAGRAGKTLLAGVDGSVRGCQAVLSGQIFGTVRHAASQVYGWPVILGALHARGMVPEGIPEKVVVSCPVVDKSNADSVIFLQSENVNLV